MRVPARRFSLAAIVMLVFAILPSGMAQERPNGFFFTTPLGLSAGYNDRFLAGNQRFSDSISVLTAPTAAFMRTTHRTRASIRYQPEFEFFTNNPDFNSINHSALFRLEHQVSARVTLEAGDYFFSTQDPSRGVGNSLLLLPRGRYNQNAAYAGVDYRWSAATKLAFRFDSAFTTATLPAPVTGRLDLVSNSGTVEMERKIGAFHTLTATYSFLRATPLRPEVAGSPVNVNLGTVAYAYQISPTLTARLSGGYVDSGQAGLVGSAVLEKRVRALWLAFGLQRYVAFFGGAIPGRFVPGGMTVFAEGLTPNITYQVASFRVLGQITRRLGTESVVQYGVNGVNRQAVSVRSTVAQTRIDYRLTDRLIVFGRTDYYNQRVTDFWPIPGRQLRALGGIEIVLARSPEAEPMVTPRRPEPEEIRRRTEDDESERRPAADSDSDVEERK